MGTLEQRRLILQGWLENVLSASHVYFQPPENVKLSYPCIVYQRSQVNVDYANDSPYDVKTSYTLTYISRDARDDIPEKLIRLPYCSHNRHYVSDNLYHDVFDIHI